MKINTNYNDKFMIKVNFFGTNRRLYLFKKKKGNRQVRNGPTSAHPAPATRTPKARQVSLILSLALYISKTTVPQFASQIQFTITQKKNP